MLKPRKRPKSPPREAMKSTGPILMLLSNSGEFRRVKHLLLNHTSNHHEEKVLPTHDSLLAKEDIDNSDVFVPGVVKLILKTRTSSISQL